MESRHLGGVAVGAEQKVCPNCHPIRGHTFHVSSNSVLDCQLLIRAHFCFFCKSVPVCRSDLEELKLSGFLAGDQGRNPKTGELALSTRYRLKDNYARFYLKYMLSARDRIEKGLFEFVSLAGLAGWDTVMGLQFENLVVNNFKSLLPRLGLENVEILSAEPYRRAAGKGHPGCQIDLLIQTERYAFIVEVKRQKSIGQKAIDEIAAKVAALPREKTTSVRTALVYDGTL